MEAFSQSPATFVLIGANIIASFVAFSNPRFMEQNLFHVGPILRQREWHRTLTSGFLHGGVFHLLVNMYVLYGFGSLLEARVFGTPGFVIVYFASLLGGSLWSEASCDTSDKDSDWVHAIAHHARSKEGVLVQLGLDNSVPDEPFSHDKRYMIEGLTSRTTVDGYYDLVDDLGKRDGRKNLRQWIDFKASDKAAKEAWKKKHPTDPLSLVGKPQPKPAAAPIAAVATGAAAFGAASLAASTPATPKPAPSTAAATLVSNAEDDDGIGWWMIAGILAGILALLFFGWLLRKQAGAPAVGNAVVLECPRGQMPAYLLDSTLEPGPITDDTSE